MSKHTTREGDVLDLICYQKAAKIEDVLKNNPALAEVDEQSLPAGIVIQFEVVEIKTTTKPTVNLWG